MQMSVEVVDVDVALVHIESGFHSSNFLFLRLVTSRPSQVYCAHTCSQDAGS